jgi:hypothetical protein
VKAPFIDSTEKNPSRWDSLGFDEGQRMARGESLSHLSGSADRIAECAVILRQIVAGNENVAQSPPCLYVSDGKNSAGPRHQRHDRTDIFFLMEIQAVTCPLRASISRKALHTHAKLLCRRFSQNSQKF